MPGGSRSPRRPPRRADPSHRRHGRRRGPGRGRSAPMPPGSSPRPSASSTAPPWRPTRLLERKGARVGLLTTEGHRDVIEMREGLKDDRYNLRMPPPEPLVPRARRLGVRERMRADGSVAVALDARSLARAIDAPRAASSVEAVAVCYLHAYRDARHEEATRAGAGARAAAACTCPCRPRCSRRSRSTSASPPRWSTPTWARPCRAT